MRGRWKASDRSAGRYVQTDRVAQTDPRSTFFPAEVTFGAKTNDKACEGLFVRCIHPASGGAREAIVVRARSIKVRVPAQGVGPQMDEPMEHSTYNTKMGLESSHDLGTMSLNEGCGWQS
jgi:hypothetical protein